MGGVNEKSKMSKPCLLQLDDGIIIAADVVLNKSVPVYEIWGGIPAKKISERI